MKNPTIKDIARLSNVSYATVSRALNDRNDINPDTKAKILNICERVGYSPNAFARTLVKKNTSTIGMIIPDVLSPFYSEMIVCIEGEVNKRGYRALWSSSLRNFQREEEYFKLFIENRVEGIIVCPTGTSSSARLLKYANRQPTVFVGDNVNSKSISYVSTDNYKGGYIGTEYLISLGHRCIAFVGARYDSITHKNRLNGYLDAMRDYKLNEIYTYDDRAVKDSLCRGYNSFSKFLDTTNVMPTAVFTATDTTALGAIQAFEERRIRVPQDISLLGFDNIIYTSLPKIMLSTIEQPKKAIAAETVNVLFKMIENYNNKNPYRIILAPKVIERNSCMAINP